ncbi:MAG: TIGR03032 family protein [Chloroflexi bacterium]|nr:TIGR03032 family protein [Chloroflexota bacterium]
MTLITDKPTTTAEFQLLNVRRYDVTASPGFAAWLAEQQVSLALTNTATHLFLLGLDPNGSLAINDYSFDRCKSITSVGDQRLYLSTRYQIWQLENAIHPSQRSQHDDDALYIPKSAYTTGGLNLHDLTVDGKGNLIFVNTFFNCLATISEHYNFRPLWRPPQLRDTKLAPGDCCHLNGLAMKDGAPAYVTSLSQSDTLAGWRDHRHNGGVITDVATNEVVVCGLSMPHSPRWYRERLWLMNSGTGEFGAVDLARGHFESLMFCPGFLRGLEFVGDYAVLGVSKLREGDRYGGLALAERLKQEGKEAECGILIIDLRSGQLVHWLTFIGKNMREIFDIAILPGLRRPNMIDFSNEAIQDLITIGPPGAL